MNDEHESSRAVLSWLREPARVDAERVVARVLGEVEFIPQRRSFGPARRYLPMNNIAKAGIAAAAVLAAAVIGYNLLPRTGGVGVQATAVPTASPTAAPTPTPPPVAPTRTQGAFPQAGALTPGTYWMQQEGIEYTFDVAGSEWLSTGQYGIDRIGGEGPDAASFIFWTDTPVGVYVDPCGSQRGPSLGDAAADLASAVAELPGTDLVRGPSDVTVGGRPAKHVVVTIRDDVACQPGSMYLWYARTPGVARTATALGSTIRVWIIDVDGTLIWIDGETFEGAEPGLELELQAIIDSIEFQP